MLAVTGETPMHVHSQGQTVNGVLILGSALLKILAKSILTQCIGSIAKEAYGRMQRTG